MLSTLTATQVAFLQVSVLQCVAAVVWALGAWFVREERAAMAHWSAYAGLSACTWWTLALYLQSPPLVAVMIGMCAAVALRAGIRRFVRRSPGWLLPTLLLGFVMLFGVLADDPAWRPLQAALNFAVLAALYLGMAVDLGRYARDQLQWRRPWLLSLPLLAGTFGFGSRALRALFWPESLWAEMSVHSALNVGSALSYIVLVLLMHATLMALVVARLVSQLQRLARRDVLTGLLNRRALHDLLEQQVRLRRRAADTFSVLMIDVDDFKVVNDRHGHETGDRALTHIAALMTQTLSAEDRIARFGGEEFVALLPGSNLERSLAEAERLRRCIDANPLAHGASPLSLSVSIGVAEWASAAEDPARLLLRADRALYRAKGLGRNRVEAARDEATAAGHRTAQA
jgi:diguanylate cyclase (GGDEF)-like protein